MRETTINVQHNYDDVITDKTYVVFWEVIGQQETAASKYLVHFLLKCSKINGDDHKFILRKFCFGFLICSKYIKVNKSNAYSSLISS